MAFRIHVTGLDELMQSLDQLGEEAPKIASQALYEGAGVMADAVSRAVQGIATEPFHYAEGGKKRKPSPEEKALVMNARKGVAKFRKNGFSVQTSVGMQNAGYGTINGKTKPIPQIANAINSGTSFMQKQPFFRKAVSTATAAATSAIEEGMKSRIDKIKL